MADVRLADGVKATGGFPVAMPKPRHGLVWLYLPLTEDDVTASGHRVDGVRLSVTLDEWEHFDRVMREAFAAPAAEVE